MHPNFDQTIPSDLLYYILNEDKKYKQILWEENRDGSTVSLVYQFMLRKWVGTRDLN